LDNRGESPCPQNVLSIYSDEYYMKQAIVEAQRALDEGEVPVGAVIVHGHRIVGRAHNLRETLNDPTAHAEILAITQAAEALRSWRLTGTTIYVTLEPCPMCAGALVNARVDRLVYGADDARAGACGTLWNLVDSEKLNHRLVVTRGMLAEDCRSLLQTFFQTRRASHPGEA
jgi:tRNA(adenine34) deaminase